MKRNRNERHYLHAGHQQEDEMKRIALYPLMAILLVAATCPPSQPVVTVTYRQIAACNGYNRNTGPGGAGPIQTVSAGGQAAFVAFKVLAIDNSKRSTSFNFDPNRMFVNGSSPAAHINTSLSLAQDLAPLSVVPVTVPAGNNQGNNGVGVVVVSTAATDGASEANNTNYFLSYEGAPGDPGVVLVKQNSSQISYPGNPNCTMITF
jgi:hypothetical protein